MQQGFRNAVYNLWACWFWFDLYPPGLQFLLRITESVDPAVDPEDVKLYSTTHSSRSGQKNRYVKDNKSITQTGSAREIAGGGGEGGSVGSACYGHWESHCLGLDSPRLPFPSTHREGWENTERGDAEGGLLFLLEANLSREYLRNSIRSEEGKIRHLYFLVTQACERFVSRIKSEFNRAVGCHADIFRRLP